MLLEDVDLSLSLSFTDCPPCYSLVQQRVNVHRGKLRDLKNLIINIGNNPAAFNDTDFREHMNKVNDSVVMLLDEARGAISKSNISLCVYNFDSAKNVYLFTHGTTRGLIGQMV